MILVATPKNSRTIDRTEILKSEWTVIAGESLVAMGSMIVVFGLIRALRALIKDMNKSV